MREGLTEGGNEGGREGFMRPYIIREGGRKKTGVVLEDMGGWGGRDFRCRLEREKRTRAKGACRQAGVGSIILLVPSL